MPPENNQTVSGVPVTSAPVKIGKWKASRMIVRESWEVLKQDKEIMLFPVFSSIVTMFAVVLMSVVYYFVVLNGNFGALNTSSDASLNTPLNYLTMFVYYLVVFFIVSFFEVCVLIVVQGRFSGQDLNMKDGLDGAKKNAGKILAWAAISATVGVILQIISDKSKILGKIVSFVLGSAWNLLTYFSLPALVIANLGVKDAFKESARVIRKNWGETIIVNFGVGLFFMVIFFVLAVFCVGAIILAPVLPMFILVGVFFVLAVIILSIISATLSTIFKLALFNYARTGEVPKGFSRELIVGAVTNK